MAQRYELLEHLYLSYIILTTLKGRPRVGQHSLLWQLPEGPKDGI